jgi:hypothetical protein
MKLKRNDIYDPDSWFKFAPPMGGKKQWVDGRSAKELARYMTAAFPSVPTEIENILSDFTTSDAEFDWAGEYVTNFADYDLGRGEGRNHDAFMFNSDIVVGIEGKADESLGSQLIGDALENASDNKRQRINGMIQMLFGDSPENHKDIRYQLVTASVATLLEASKKNVNKAMLMVVVFKKDGYYSEKKIANNNADIQNFLNDISAKDNGEYYTIPTAYGKEKNIEFYFKHIEITVK